MYREKSNHKTQSTFSAVKSEIAPSPDLKVDASSGQMIFFIYSFIFLKILFCVADAFEWYKQDL